MHFGNNKLLYILLAIAAFILGGYLFEFAETIF